MYVAYSPCIQSPQIGKINLLEAGLMVQFQGRRLIAREASGKMAMLGTGFIVLFASESVCP